MTSKELLYIEDALSHEQHFKTQCQQAAEQLQDTELKNLVDQMVNSHQQIYDQLYNLL